VSVITSGYRQARIRKQIVKRNSEQKIWLTIPSMKDASMLPASSHRCRNIFAPGHHDFAGIDRAPGDALLMTLGDQSIE
jgi:hypothetical protein